MQIPTGWFLQAQPEGTARDYLAFFNEAGIFDRCLRPTAGCPYRKIEIARLAGISLSMAFLKISWIFE
jgi:hypothetical protein